MAINRSTESDLELYYDCTPSTIRSLCDIWKMSNHDLTIYLHGAYMFLSPLNNAEIVANVEKELDFLCKIVRIR